MFDMFLNPMSNEFNLFPSQRWLQGLISTQIDQAIMNLPDPVFKEFVNTSNVRPIPYITKEGKLESVGTFDPTARTFNIGLSNFKFRAAGDQAGIAIGNFYPINITQYGKLNKTSVSTISGPQMLLYSSTDIGNERAIFLKSRSNGQEYEADILEAYYKDTLKNNNYLKIGNFGNQILYSKLKPDDTIAYTTLSSNQGAINLGPDHDIYITVNGDKRFIASNDWTRNSLTEIRNDGTSVMRSHSDTNGFSLVLNNGYRQIFECHNASMNDYTSSKFCLEAQDQLSIVLNNGNECALDCYWNGMSLGCDSRPIDYIQLSVKGIAHLKEQLGIV